VPEGVPDVEGVRPGYVSVVRVRVPPRVEAREPRDEPLLRQEPPTKTSRSDVSSLAQMRAGDRGIVSEIRSTAARIDKLAALGILPGVEVRVQQNKPVVVVELGETVLAIERELAEGIVVSPF
jgi:Fe2+ transport system protein FeoA